MIADRVKEFLDSVNNYKDAKNILVVTHAVSLRMIMPALKNTLPEYPKNFPNNGEILKVRLSGLGKVYEIESIFPGNSRDFNHNP